jgi:malate dehydrogenase (oxaloacetate-decarboxylating)(NADP+)
VKHPEVAKIQQAIEIVRRRKPDLEIDGEMQPEMALDAERRHQYYGFSRLTRSANMLVFPTLAAANATYQTLKVLGGASAMGPIMLGLSRPCVALQNEVTVDEIVNMTAYVVLKAQQMRKEAIRA